MLINMSIEIDKKTSNIDTKYIKLNNILYFKILKGNTILLVKYPISRLKYKKRYEILISDKVLMLLNSEDQYQMIIAFKLIENKLKIKILNK